MSTGSSCSPALEVDVAEGGHILVSGPKDKLHEVRALQEDHLTADRFIGLERLFERHPRGLMVIGGHPYR